jgi:phage terminase small subunit
MTNMQLRFIEEYLKCLNGTEAARRAGYSPRTAHQIAYENLRKPEIRTIIDTAFQARDKAIAERYAYR